MGIDLAKSSDFTAYALYGRMGIRFGLSILEASSHRFHTASGDACGEPKRFWNPRALVDAGTAGSAVIELMREQGINVEEFTFTNDRKARIVTDLVLF